MVADDEQIPDYWNDWRLTPDEFNRVIHTNSNALSAIFGYVAEERVRDIHLENSSKISNIRTPEDQDSADNGDWVFEYQGEPMRIECKSLQTASIEKVESQQKTLNGNENPTEWEATFHIKGSSDQRTIEYEGEDYDTTLLDLEETDIDIMAVNLYRIKDKWDFGFAKMGDLPRSAGNYPEGLREKLAKSQPKIELPLREPFTDNLCELMDEVLEEREDT